MSGSVSGRVLLVDSSDRIYRLGSARFFELLTDPRQHRFPAFSGQRVRMAIAIVVVTERKPIRVVGGAYYILRFDVTGCLDAESFRRDQESLLRAEAERVSARVSRGTGVPRASGVIDATYRFLARAGIWVPSETLEQALREAALGHVKQLF
jgi:hypothetical protein